MTELSNTRRIFLDTNAMQGRPGDVRLAALDELSATSWTLDASCIINSVTLEELERHMREAIASDIKRTLDASKRIARLLGEDADVVLPDFPNPTHLGWKATRRFRQQLKAQGFLLSAYPSVSHESLVARDLDRRKPFRASGKGYRDALVWESIKGLVSKFDGDVVIISADTDFVTQNGQLATELGEELASLGVASDAIHAFRSIQEALEQHLSLQLTKITELVGNPIEAVIGKGELQKVIAMLDSSLLGLGELCNLPGPDAEERDERVVYVFHVQADPVTSAVELGNGRRAIGFPITATIAMEWDEPLDHQMMGTDTGKADIRIAARLMLDKSGKVENVTLGALRSFDPYELELEDMLALQGPDEDIEQPLEPLDY